MVPKIKKFKGSLNPIFDGIGDHQGITDQEVPNHLVVKDHLPIDRIKPRQNQPRKNFDKDSLEELAQSIKSKGVIQPIIVRPIHDGYYEIIVGERRWRASKQIGLGEIPAIVRDYGKSDRMAVALIENIQRKNLNPLEEAQAIYELIEECSMTHLEVAEGIGKSRATISNLVRLLNLEPEVKVMVNASLLEMGHARALLSLSGQAQIDAAQLVVNRSLSVRDTEKLVQGMQRPVTKQEDIRVDPRFEERAKQWKTYMSQQLSSRVNLHIGAEGKGKMVIYFDSIEEADWLIDHIDVKKEQRDY